MDNEVSLKGSNDLVVTVGNIITTGYIQVGNGSTCDSSNTGAISYNYGINRLEFCNGEFFEPIGMSANYNCNLTCQLGSASSMGGYDYQCAIKLDNTVICWGGGDKIISVPDSLKAEQIALGQLYACALKLDHTVQCWGLRGHTTVPNGLVAKQISAGTNNICALKHDNTVQCWGANDSGQNNVPDALTAKQVTAGHGITCALKLDNTIQCWGDTHNNPISVIPEGLLAKQIVLSFNHMCALKIDNTVECWG
ncbi:hypothetical protein BMR04_15820, partial [Methylococcaceae bacterium HT3]